MMLPLTAPLAGCSSWNNTTSEASLPVWVMCRGTVWLRDRPVQDFGMFQQWLDDQRAQPQALFQLDGDFLLSYCAPDASHCVLYRPLTAGQTIYYCLDGEVLRWSTVIEDVLDHLQTLDDVDQALLAPLVCAGESDPECTPYRGIRCLRAGQWLSFSPSESIKMAYDAFHWEDRASLPWEEAAQLYRQCCSEAIQRAIFGHERIGIFLSGGLDSAVLAFEARALGHHVEGLHWAWSQIPAFHQEQQMAQCVAETLQIPCHLIDESASIEAGGTYLQTLSNIPLPYNHSFFSSFQHTAQCARQQHLSLLLTGHLGDTLFESDLLDGIQEKVHRGRLLAASSDLLSRYARRQAFQTLWAWFTSRKWTPTSGARQRIERCTWLTPSAQEAAQATGQYVYPIPQPFVSESTGRVYQALLSNINAETFRDTIRCHYALFPQEIALKHPYLSRKLIECCLSFGRQHRTLFAAGEALSKPLARLAYLGDLPPALLRREVRLPYAAVDEQYALHNREALADLLGKDSYLVRLGILDPKKLCDVLAESDLLQQQASALLPAAGVELWLRLLDKHPWQQPVPPRYQRRSFWADLPHLSTHLGSACLALAPSVQAYEIHQQLILIQRKTDQVLKLDQATHLFLRLLVRDRTIPQALTSLSETLAEPVDETLWCAALKQLVTQGWIVCPPVTEEPPTLEKEDPNV